MQIKVSPEVAQALGLTTKQFARLQAWRLEHPQTGVANGGVNRKGQQVLVPIYRKQWLKLRAQMAFVMGGKSARDAIYPQRHKLFEGV